MHEGARNTMPRRRGIRRALGLVVGLALVLAVVFGLRTDAVLRPALEARVAPVAAQLGATVTIGHIGPSGLTGLVLRDVTVVPASGGPALAEVAEVRIHPRLRGLIGSGPPVRSIDIVGADIDVALDSSGAGHAPWLSERLSSAGANDVVGVAPSGRRWRDVPTVRVLDSAVQLRDPAGRYPTVATRIESVTLTGLAGDPEHADRADLEGHVEVDGLGRALLIGTLGGHEGLSVTLRTLHDNDLFEVLPDAWTPSAEATFSLGAVTAAWPPEVSARPVSLQMLNLPLPGVDAWRLDSVWSDEVRVSVDAAGLHVAVRNVRAGLSGLIAETELNIRRASWTRSWSGTEEALDVAVVDEDGDVAQLAWSRDGTGRDRLRVIAEAFDGDAVVPLLPEAVPARMRGGIFDVDVAIDRDAEGAWSGDVAIEAHELTVHAEMVSTAPVIGVDAGIQLSFLARPGEHDIAIPDARLRLGEVEVAGRGRVELGGRDVAARGWLELPSTPAQALIDALPRGLAPVIEDFALGGETSARLRIEIDTRDVDHASMDVDIDADDVQVLRFGARAPIPWLNADDFSWDVRTFEGDTRRVGPGSPEWVRLDEMSEYLFRAVLAAEDDRFFMHRGFDERGILRALHANLEAGRVVRGGSTISQQVVKNLFLSHERTLSRKVQEAFLTWLLEAYVSKRRILEVYVNVVHWGPGIYGIGDASMAYFRHVPRRLTLRESAFLASILPNPALFGEQYSRRIVAPSRREKMRNILNNMRAQGVIDADTMAWHARMIDRGEVSMTPPPAELGTYRRPTSAASELEDRRGARLLFP